MKWRAAPKREPEISKTPYLLRKVKLKIRFERCQEWTSKCHGNGNGICNIPKPKMKSKVIVRENHGKEGRCPCDAKIEASPAIIPISMPITRRKQLSRKSICESNRRLKPKARRVANSPRRSMIFLNRTSANRKYRVARLNHRGFEKWRYRYFQPLDNSPTCGRRTQGQKP